MNKWSSKIDADPKINKKYLVVIALTRWLIKTSPKSCYAEKHTTSLLIIYSLTKLFPPKRSIRMPTEYRNTSHLYLKGFEPPACIIPTWLVNVYDGVNVFQMDIDSVIIQLMIPDSSFTRWILYGY